MVPQTSGRAPSEVLPATSTKKMTEEQAQAKMAADDEDPDCQIAEHDDEEDQNSYSANCFEDEDEEEEEESAISPTSKDGAAKAAIDEVQKNEDVAIDEVQKNEDAAKIPATEQIQSKRIDHVNEAFKSREEEVQEEEEIHEEAEEIHEEEDPPKQPIGMPSQSLRCRKDDCEEEDTHGHYSSFEGSMSSPQPRRPGGRKAGSTNGESRKAFPDEENDQHGYSSNFEDGSLRALVLESARKTGLASTEDEREYASEFEDDADDE